MRKIKLRAIYLPNLRLVVVVMRVGSCGHVIPGQILVNFRLCTPYLDAVKFRTVKTTLFSIERVQNRLRVLPARGSYIAQRFQC